MTKRQIARMNRLLPHDPNRTDRIPRWIRIYDNGGPSEGGTIDRYTVLYTGRYKKSAGQHQFVGMSCAPFHPQGFCIHEDHPFPVDRIDGRWGGVDIGRKHPSLGRRIEWDDLPEDCRKVISRDYREIWDLPVDHAA